MADYPFTSNYTDTVPNVVDSTLKNDTYYPSVSIAKRGKHPIVAKSVTTYDEVTSNVVKDFEDRNNKAVTTRPSDIKMTFDIAADFDLLGKVVANLQKDAGVSADNIVGTLKYVTDYTGFSSDPEEQEGNYLAFKVAFDDAFTNITAQKGDGAEKDYDPTDSTFIFIMDKHYPITLRAYNGDKVVSTKVYRTDQLIFEAKA